MKAADLIAFEADIARMWEAGDLPYLIHLSGGNEAWLLQFFEDRVRPGDWIFSTHRNHYHALLAGIPPLRLKEKIARGDSMFVYDREHNFFTSAILAGQCGVACGVAWALQEERSPNTVWCFLGDGAEEEGHFYEAAMFTMSHNLPLRFIIEDNDRAVETTKQERGWFRQQWPCVIRYNYQPTWPHAGSGTKNHITFKERQG